MAAGAAARSERRAAAAAAEVEEFSGPPGWPWFPERESTLSQITQCPDSGFQHNKKKFAEVYFFYSTFSVNFFFVYVYSVYSGKKISFLMHLTNINL